ncbi:MAG: carbohydrate-binding protein, partial [Lentimonas sp.]
MNVITQIGEIIPKPYLPLKGTLAATIESTLLPLMTTLAKHILSKTVHLWLVLATSTSLFSATWDGGGDDDEYSTALNWSDDLVPSGPAETTQDISGAYTVVRNVDSTSARTLVNDGAVLNVTSGSHNDSKAGNTIRNFVGNGSSGTVNMSGASTTYLIGHKLAIAYNSNSDGAFYHTGGALNVYRGSNSLIGGYGGLFALGHSISIGGNSTHTNGTGIYEISDGSLNTRTGVGVGNNGIFSIVGSAATEIRLGGSNTDAGWFALSADGTLKATIDAGGITPIYVEDDGAMTSAVELQAGSLLDLSFNIPAINGTWTLIEVEDGDVVDNGLALAPGVSSDWSFAIDNSGTNGLLTVSYMNGGRNSVTVTSLAELVLYMDDSYTDVVMAPGTYQIGPDDVTSGLLDDGDTYLFHFSGSDSTFDFTGVKFEIDTYIYRSFGNNEVRAIEITGQDLVLSNLTMEDIGTARPGKTALAVKLNGWRNLVEGFTITIRGAVPYGYGDIFGKGAGPVISHKKHSGILIAGDDNTLRDATLYHRAYGHGIFVQGAINTLIEGCYVEGELSTTDRVLAEAGTGSRADNAAFQTVWGFPLRAGNAFSLQEDGIRTYNTGSDQTGAPRNTADITVRDCTVYRMRSGVTIGFTNGTQYVDNCVAIQCENAYWIQNGDIVDSAADSQVGIVLSSPYGNSGTKNVDLTIVKNDNEGGEHNRMLAYIAGRNDNITFRSSAANTSVNQNIKLVVGGNRDSYRYDLTDTGLIADQGVINNLTNYPVELSSKSSSISGSSWGAVTNNGSSNSVTSTTHSTLGGYAMMQTIQAEDFTAESGTVQLPTNNGGISVGDIQDGDWIRFDDVIFGSGPKYIEALVAGWNNGGSIEVRLDTAAGTLLGTLNVSGSATPENWVTETVAIARTQGMHDVYLVFTGGAGDLLELDHFKFTERDFDPYNRDSDNLIAHYKFDEGTGSIATDATGNGHDGTISNASWTTGTEQGALAFDGSSSTVEIPGSLLDNMEEEITVSLWVYGDDTQPLVGSVFYAQSAGGDRILNGHLPYSDSNIYWDSGNSSGYDRLQKVATTGQFEGQWNHWTFVKNTSQSDTLIYHNGELFAASQTSSEAIGDATAASIGSRLGINNYLGTIDDVKFYNAALSRNEVKEMYDRYLAIDSYTLTYTAGSNGSITGTRSQTIDHGFNGTAVTA